MIIICKKLESTKQSFRHVGVNAMHCDVICLQTHNTKQLRVFISIRFSFLILLFLWLFYFTIVLYIWHGTSKTRVIIRLIVSCIVISAYFKCIAVLACEQAYLCEFRGKIILPAEPFSSRDGGSAAKNFPWTCTSEPARRLLLFTWRWNLEAILLNNERLSLVNTKFPTKKWRVVALILLSYKLSVILKLKDRMKLRLMSRISSYLKILSVLKLFNFYKTSNKSAWIHTNQILLSRNRLKLSQ